MPHPIVSYLTTLTGMARAAAPRALTPPVPSTARWSAQRAQEWEAGSDWMMGCNFIPSNAGSQLEMWQPETWSPDIIEKELGWAAELGMNSVRVFLHDLLFAHEGEAFLDRVDAFLRIADGHGISTMLVLFDGVWHPEPRLGPQGEPKPCTHNSMWVQGPGAAVLGDRSRWIALRPYVESVLRRFGGDHRVCVWDLFNEPDQTNAISYPRKEVAGKSRLVNDLVGHVFDWCQAIDPDQPLTAGVYLGVTGSVERVSALNRTLLGRSDVISFHSYSPRKPLLATIEHLKRYDRPLLCTEWMARTLGSPVRLIDVLADENVSAWCWGLVDGRSQTRYSWTSWFKRPDENARWFHDLLHADGRPYDETEAVQLRTAAARMGAGHP
jgi:hypothetical protein